MYLYYNWLDYKYTQAVEYSYTQNIDIYKKYQICQRYQKGSSFH